MKRSWYSWILLVTVIVTVVWYVFKNIRIIVDYEFAFSIGYWLCSILTLLSGYFIMFFVWTRIAAGFGLHASLLKTARFYYLSQLGKYMPGNVGLILVRLHAYSDYSKRKVATGIAIEYIVNIIGVSIVALVGLACVPVHVPPICRCLAMVLPVLFLVLLHPSIFLRLANWAFKLLKKDPIDKSLSYGMLLFLSGANIAVSLLFGLGFFLSLRALGYLTIEYYLPVAGGFAAAFFVGIVMPFAPGGIGVREWVLFIILPAFVPKPSVIVAAVVFRLTATAVELLLAAVASVLSRTRSRAIDKLP